MPAIIYQIINIINNKIYIGKTKQKLSKRWYRHLYEAKNGCDFYLHRAIRKYSEEFFEIKIIEKVDNEICSEREKYWIFYYDSMNPEKGYNSTSGGEGNFFVSEQTKNKSRLSKLGVKNPMFGKKHSLETKEKRSTALKKVKKTKEWLKKIGNATKGRIYITNSIKNRRIYKNEPIPEGWKLGRILK
jgi:group I intron endonuclease